MLSQAIREVAQLVVDDSERDPETDDKVSVLVKSTSLARSVSAHLPGQVSPSPPPRPGQSQSTSLARPASVNLPGQVSLSPPHWPQVRPVFVYVTRQANELSRLSLYRLFEIDGARAEFLYSWWGSCPTNFEVRPTNFVLCHTNFWEIWWFSGL